MASTIPVLVGIVADKSKVGLVDERSGTQGLARDLMCQPRRCQPAQLVINERKKLFGADGSQRTTAPQHTSHGLIGRGHNGLGTAHCSAPLVNCPAIPRLRP